MVLPFLLGIFLLIVLYFYFWYITIPVTIIIIVIIWLYNRDNKNDSTNPFENTTTNSGSYQNNSDYTATGSYSKTGLLKSRLKRFDLSEEEAELLFGKKWRTKLDSWNYDLFYKIVQMKLDLTDPSKSFRKKVSHIIDKVIRIIDSVWIEYSQEVKKLENLFNTNSPGSSDWLEREWEFFKKYKKPSSEYSENALEISEAYEILGLSIAATLDQVKERFRELALRWHPDKNDSAIKTEAEKKFVRINLAYETIIGAA